MNIYADYSNRLDPNCYTQGREGHSVIVLVCHNTAGPSDLNFPGQDHSAAQKFSDQAAVYLTSNPRQVSIHWMVGAEACGAPIYRIVPEESIAYHAGGTMPNYPSRWVNPDDNTVYSRYGLNQVSIGIELFGQEKDVVGPNQLASLKTLVQDIVGRYPILAKPGHIVPHASLEGDRTDGNNWFNQARAWAAAVVPGGAAPTVTPVSYQVTITVPTANVRSGPARPYPVISTIQGDPNKQYLVDGETHGDAIPDKRQPSGSDDVWSHLPEVNGFVTRTALNIVTPAPKPS